MRFNRDLARTKFRKSGSIINIFSGKNPEPRGRRPEPFFKPRAFDAEAADFRSKHMIDDVRFSRLLGAFDASAEVQKVLGENHRPEAAAEMIAELIHKPANAPHKDAYAFANWMLRVRKLPRQ